MKKLLLTIFAALSLAAVGALLVPEAQTALAAPKDDVCAGLQTTGAGAGCAQSGTTVESVIRAVIVILSWVVGVVSVIMIIVGGFKYITSGGDSGNIQSAKNTIIYALVGLVIVAFAQILVAFVLDRVVDGANKEEERRRQEEQSSLLYEIPQSENRNIETNRAYVL